MLKVRSRYVGLHHLQNINVDRAANNGKIYEDQIHGFALRSDWSSDKDKKAMDDAEKQGIAWFKKHLK